MLKCSIKPQVDWHRCACNALFKNPSNSLLRGPDTIGGDRDDGCLPLGSGPAGDSQLHSERDGGAVLPSALVGAGVRRRRQWRRRRRPGRRCCLGRREEVAASAVAAPALLGWHLIRGSAVLRGAAG